jgi:hypothetical protein
LLNSVRANIIRYMMLFRLIKNNIIKILLTIVADIRPEL